MTAEQAREYETNCTLITEDDKDQYDTIMDKVRKAISGPIEGVRAISHRGVLSRRVQNKLRQDHYQLSFMSDGSVDISWEPLNTDS
jgi:hypothetical protein